MATRTITLTNCDRCPAKTEDEDWSCEIIIDAKEPTADGKRNAVRYHDLCPKCRKRVLDLIEQMKPHKRVSATPEPDTAPNPPEGADAMETPARDAGSDDPQAPSLS